MVPRIWRVLHWGKEKRMEYINGMQCPYSGNGLWTKRVYLWITLNPDIFFDSTSTLHLLSILPLDSSRRTWSLKIVISFSCTCSFFFVSKWMCILLLFPSPPHKTKKSCPCHFCCFLICQTPWTNSMPLTDTPQDLSSLVLRGWQRPFMTEAVASNGGNSGGDQFPAALCRDCLMLVPWTPYCQEKK